MDGDAKARAKDAADKLAERARRLREDHSEGEFEAAFNEMSNLLAEYANELPSRGESRISSFFAEVGEGMVEAQRLLNVQSSAYNSGLPSRSLASLYRIPKVSAEIRFALSQRSQSGFNFLIVNSRDERSLTQQNSVSFDIVSAPPPPDYLEALPVDTAFVFGVQDRMFIQTALSDRLTAEPSLGDTEMRVVGTALDHFTRTLVLVTGAETWLMLTFLSTDRDSLQIETFEYKHASGQVMPAVPGQPQAIPPVFSGSARGRWLLEHFARIAEQQHEALQREETER